MSTAGRGWNLPRSRRLISPCEAVADRVMSTVATGAPTNRNRLGFRLAHGIVGTPTVARSHATDRAHDGDRGGRPHGQLSDLHTRSPDTS
jgi:hypothetical protein